MTVRAQPLRNPPTPIPVIAPTMQDLVEKSHGEYWLQVSAQRLLKVECAEAQHVPDMAKLEACIEKVGTSTVSLLLYDGPCRGLSVRGNMPATRCRYGGEARRGCTV